MTCNNTANATSCFSTKNKIDFVQSKNKKYAYFRELCQTLLSKVAKIDNNKI